MDKTVHLGRLGQEEVEMLVSQVTPLTVSRVFGVDANTVWLREEYGTRAFFPDPSTNNTQFVFPSDIGSVIVSLVVEGSPSRAHNHPASTVPVATPLQIPPHSGPSTSGTSFRPLQMKKSFSVKVTKADVSVQANGKIKLSKVEQMFIDVTDDTSNVHYINSIVQEKWGPGHITVTNDGLPVEDSSGTQGFKFWRTPARKIYAVNKSDLKRKVKKPSKHHFVSSDDDDDDFQVRPLSKKSKIAAGISDQVKQVATEVHEIHQELRSVLQIAGSMKVPIGLQHLIRDTFRCHICQATPLVPPVIYSRCCKRIIGCQTCVDTWYGGENGTSKSCPICRAERAFAETTQLRGMDDFLEGVMPLFSEEALAGRQDVSV